MFEKNNKKKNILPFNSAHAKADKAGLTDRLNCDYVPDHINPTN